MAALFSRISQAAEIYDPLFQEALALRNAVIRWAPGVYEEILSSRRDRRFISTKPSGLLEPKVHIKADGPLLKGYLNAFSTKIGLALFRKHAGHALPADGVVMARWFLNAGLTQEVADTLLAFMPEFSTLNQGKLNALGQFGYRYNSDDRTVVATLSQFHEGLYVFNIATATPEAHGLPREWLDGIWSKPGDLLKMIPLGPQPIHMFGRSAA